MPVNITFKELNILQKFLSNRVDYDYFKEIIQKTYVMDYEVQAHWETFNKNQISFITSLGNVGQDLLDKILLDIEERNYNG